MAGMPWLDVYCPGCRTSRAIDIRTIDRHPLASVGGLVMGAAVFVVFGIDTDARDQRAACIAGHDSARAPNAHGA
jgi:hypothetical protein